MAPPAKLSIVTMFDLRGGMRFLDAF